MADRTTCQMSNVCCALCNVVVKTPDDPLTRRPQPWCRTIWSSGHFVSGSFYNFIEHRTTDIRHLTSLGSRHFSTAPMTAPSKASTATKEERRERKNCFAHDHWISFRSSGER